MFGVLLLLFLALALVACGGDEEGAEATVEPVATLSLIHI